MTTTVGIDRHWPKTPADARRLVHYGPRTHGSRRVVLDFGATPRRHVPGWVLDVRRPVTDGELLTVVVTSGMIPLRVLGGNVHVILGSSWGNVVDVTEQARATTSVEVWERCKVTATGVDPARVTGDLGRYRSRETGNPGLAHLAMPEGTRYRAPRGYDGALPGSRA